jgi:PIN domain nuclease of toxin-antitoxin system
MSSVVIDTHSAIWYLEKSASLSDSGFDAIDTAARTGGNICLASISLVEVTYLIEKSRIRKEALERLVQACTDSATGWILVPLDMDVVQSISKVARDLVPDMPDRIIAATALHLNLPLVTRDSKLRASGIRTIW